MVAGVRVVVGAEADSAVVVLAEALVVVVTLAVVDREAVGNIVSVVKLWLRL